MPAAVADMSVPPPMSPQPTASQEPSDFARSYQQMSPPPVAPSAGFLPGSPARSTQNNVVVATAAASSSSLMQSLMVERRQRQEEYLRHHPHMATSPDSDWPGFEHSHFGGVAGAGDFINNLWDSPAQQQQQPQQHQQAPPPQTNVGLNNWGVSEDVWPNAYPLNLQQQLGSGGVGVGEATNFGGAGGGGGDVGRSSNLFDHINSFNYVPVAPAAPAGDSIWDMPVKEQQAQQQSNGDRSSNSWATLFNNKEPTT